MSALDVLVVDDHEIVREGLVAALSGGTSRVVAAVGRGDDALAVLAVEHVDCAIVDIRLPDMSGLDLTAAIRRGHPATSVIVLSTYLSEETVRASREAGAAAYVAKSAGVAELRRALDAVAVGDRPPTESDAQVVHRLRDASGTDPDAIVLSPQQERVLGLAAAGATDRQIATALFISESTVRFHLQRVKALLGARSKTQVIAEALRRELIRPDPGDRG